MMRYKRFGINLHPTESHCFQGGGVVLGGSGLTTFEIY